MDDTRTVPLADEVDPTAPRPHAPAIAGPLGLVPLFATVVATLTIYALWGGRGGLLALSALAAVFAVATSLHVGGHYVVPSGVFFLASGVFVGGGGYYLSVVDTPVPLELIRDATALALLTTVAIALVVRVMSIEQRISWPTLDAPGPTQPPTHFALKGVVLVVASQIPLVRSTVGPIAEALGLAGILILVLWAASRRLRLQWYGDALVVALAFLLPLLWTRLTFSGGGRLVVAGLGIAAFTAWNLLKPRRTQKVLVILAIPVFLWAAGLNRSNDAPTAGSVVSQGEGLGSVYSPLETWARMIGPLEPETRDLLMPRWGGTFVNTVLLPVPRSIWPDKPDGFGAELTEVFEPDLAKGPHSMAALVQGEWYANFGFAGLVLMVPATGVVLVMLDKRHARLARDGPSDPASWWRAVVIVCCVSSIADYYWVGSFMFMARGGLAAVVAILVSRVSLSRQAPRRPWAPAAPEGGT